MWACFVCLFSGSHLQGCCPHSEHSGRELGATAALSPHSLPRSEWHPHTGKPRPQRKQNDSNKWSRHFMLNQQHHVGTGMAVRAVIAHFCFLCCDNSTMFLNWQSSTGCECTPSTVIAFVMKKGIIPIIPISNQRQTWYPEKAGASAVEPWPPFTSELEIKVVNGWNRESKLLSVGRAGGGWDKPSTPGQDMEPDSRSQRRRKSSKDFLAWNVFPFSLSRPQIVTAYIFTKK